MDPLDPQRLTISELARAIESAPEPVPLGTGLPTLVGVLSILFRSPRAFTEDDRARATSLADHVASVAHEISSPLDIWRSSQH